MRLSGVEVTRLDIFDGYQNFCLLHASLCIMLKTWFSVSIVTHPGYKGVTNFTGGE